MFVRSAIVVDHSSCKGMYVVFGPGLYIGIAFDIRGTMISVLVSEQAHE